MHCVHPYRAFPTGRKTESGKDEYFFSMTGDDFIPVSSLHKKWPDGGFSQPLTDFIEVPCLHCYGCRQDRANMWVVRCLAEALQTKGDTLFITLTYAKKKPFPEVADLSNFLRKVRDYFGHDTRIRFFACGEYGEKNGRAHIHAVLFGCPFPEDAIKYDARQFTSITFEKLWGLGFCPFSRPVDVGAVSGYVAKYLLKDYGRSGAWLNMSRKPGIGSPYLEEHFLDDGLVLLGNGKGKVFKSGLPKFLRQRFEIQVPEVSALFAAIKEDAHVGQCGGDPNYFPDVERVRELDNAVKEGREIYRKSVIK